MMYIAGIEFPMKQSPKFQRCAIIVYPSMQKGKRKKQQKMGNKSATIDSLSRSKVRMTVKLLLQCVPNSLK